MLEKFEKERKSLETVLNETILNFEFDSEKYPVLKELELVKQQHINQLIFDNFSIHILLHIASGSYTLDDDGIDMRQCLQEFFKFFSHIEEKIQPRKHEVIAELQNMVKEIAQEVSNMFSMYTQEKEKINDTIYELHEVYFAI